MLSSKIDVPGGVTGQMRQLVEGFQNSAEQMATPLPEEPVGVGGKWSVTQSLELNGMKLQQTATYTVIELSEERAKLH